MADRRSQTTLDAVGAYCLGRALAWQSLGDPWMRAVSDNDDDWMLQADLLERGMRLRPNATNGSASTTC